MAFNRQRTQRFLEEENNAHIDNLLQKTRALNGLATEISVEIRDSIRDIDDVVRRPPARVAQRRSDWVRICP